MKAELLEVNNFLMDEILTIKETLQHAEEMTFTDEIKH